MFMVRWKRRRHPPPPPPPAIPLTHYAPLVYRRSTIFHCCLIFVGRGKNENKIYNTIQNSGTVMHFLVQNLKIKKW